LRRREESVEKRVNKQRTGVFDQENGAPGYLRTCMGKVSPRFQRSSLLVNWVNDSQGRKDLRE